MANHQIRHTTLAKMNDVIEEEEKVGREPISISCTVSGTIVILFKPKHKN